MAAGCVRRHDGRVLLVSPEQKKFSFDRVLACVDLTPSAQTVAAEAKEFASLCGALLELLHVFQAPWETIHHRAPSSERSPKDRQEFLSKLRQKLEMSCAASGIESEEITLHSASNSGKGVVEYVSRKCVNLVFLGTHGYRSMKNFSGGRQPNAF